MAFSILLSFGFSRVLAYAIIYICCENIQKIDKSKNECPLILSILLSYALNNNIYLFVFNFNFSIFSYKFVENGVKTRVLTKTSSFTIL